MTGLRYILSDFPEAGMDSKRMDIVMFDEARFRSNDGSFKDKETLKYRVGEVPQSRLLQIHKHWWEQCWYSKTRKPAIHNKKKSDKI